METIGRITVSVLLCLLSVAIFLALVGGYIYWFGMDTVATNVLAYGTMMVWIPATIVLLFTIWENPGNSA